MAAIIEVIEGPMTIAAGGGMGMSESGIITESGSTGTGAGTRSRLVGAMAVAMASVVVVVATATVVLPPDKAKWATPHTCPRSRTRAAAAAIRATWLPSRTHRRRTCPTLTRRCDHGCRMSRRMRVCSKHNRHNYTELIQHTQKKTHTNVPQLACRGAA